MPNRTAHLATSAPVGAAFAYNKAQYYKTIQRFLEAAGGTLGGLLGGALPDILDPPLHPGHRAQAHAVLPVSLAAIAWLSALDKWQSSLREQAEEYALRQFQTVEPSLKALYGGIEIALRMLSGVLAGFIAGYLTHIVLDSTTPRGLPLMS